MSYWELLGIPPTDDITLIKKAYAEKSKLYHPETHPEQFQELHQAYKFLVAQCKRKKAYEEKLQAIDRDRFILEESRPVIDAFLEFYRSVEGDIILNIKENTHKPKLVFQNRNDVNNNKKTITGVDVDNRIDTGIRESQPQRVDDLQSILHRIFGPFCNIK